MYMYKFYASVRCRHGLLYTRGPAWLGEFLYIYIPPEKTGFVSTRMTLMYISDLSATTH